MKRLQRETLHTCLCWPQGEAGIWVQAQEITEKAHFLRTIVWLDHHHITCSISARKRQGLRSSLGIIFGDSQVPCFLLSQAALGKSLLGTQEAACDLLSHGNSNEAGLGGGCSLACHLPSFPRRCWQGLTWALSNGPSLLRLSTHVDPLLTLSQHAPFEDPGESSKTNQRNSLDSRASDIKFNKSDILEMGF